MDLHPRANPVPLGALLGLVNTVVIAIGMSAQEHDRIGMIMLVSMFACVPAVLTGAVIGTIASTIPTSPVWLRRALLIAPALGLLGGLALMFRLTAFVPIASIPTIACALYLERRTRGESVLPTVVAR